MHTESRFLIPQSLELMQHYIKAHPVPGSAIVLGVFIVVLAILWRVFERIAIDVIIFALIISLISLFSGGAIFTLFHIKGFHFIH